MSAIERLLVRLPNWLGDALLARPVLHAVRAAHPRAEIRAVGPAAPLELLAGEHRFDRGEPWPPDGAGRATLLRSLRAWRPDAALVLPPSFSSAWFAWRTGAPIRVGYRHEARAPLLSHGFPRPPRGDLHLSLEYLALGRVLGAEPVALPRLVPPAAGVAAWERLRAEHGLSGREYAMLGPGAIYGPAKRWGADRYAALGRGLVARGTAVLVCGAGSDRDVCDAVARAIGTGAIALAGVTDLATQTALCAGASLAVCNDSGLAHVAAATGARTVVVFGSTSSAWTAPLGARVRVVQRAPVCSPCFQRTCRIGTVCLSAITVEDVTRAAERVA